MEAGAMSGCGLRWSGYIKRAISSPGATLALLAVVSLAILVVADLSGADTAHRAFAGLEAVSYWLRAVWHATFAWLTARVVYIAYQDNFG